MSTNRRLPVALTIAGSDSGGGAGIAADLKTFAALGVWGAVAVTAVTAQNTRAIRAIEIITPRVVRAQIEAVSEDLGVDAAKTGMLGSADVLRAVAMAVRQAGISQLVVDPVVSSKHADRLLAAGALDVLRSELVPLARVLTPNLAEASLLTGVEITDRQSMVEAAARLHDLGPEVVLLKGGHLADANQSPDLVYTVGGIRWLEGRRIEATHTHGTGCVLSAAITAELAGGRDPVEACQIAKSFVAHAIVGGLGLGGGTGPVDPCWATGGRAPRPGLRSR